MGMKVLENVNYTWFFIQKLLEKDLRSRSSQGMWQDTQILLL